MVMIVDLIRRCNQRIGWAQGDLDIFRSKIEADPHNGLYWSEDYFMRAAEYKVYLSIRTTVEEFKLSAEQGKNTLSAEAWVDVYKAHMVAKVLDLARDKIQSTSATANIMDAYTRIAWAKALDMFD